MILGEAEQRKIKGFQRTVIGALEICNKIRAFCAIIRYNKD